MESSDLLTVADAAEQLQRSTEQVRRYLRERRLAGQRIGGQWFIEQRALDEFTSTVRHGVSFVSRIPDSREADPLGSIIAIGAGGGSNLADGKNAYRRAYRWRR